jgi:hypothetical protein
MTGGYGFTPAPQDFHENRPETDFPVIAKIMYIKVTYERSGK